MDIHYEKTVGQTVAEDFRTAAVFTRYGIDFCCKGNITIDEACERKNILTEDVMRELKLLLAGNTDTPADFNAWSPSTLTDYIETNHHQYINTRTPVILQYLNKLVQVHGANHPELSEIHRLFHASAADLAQHMKKEELILFPRIRKINALANGPEGTMLSGMLQNPIEVMMHEHDTEGDRFRKIDELTQHYQPPADACNTYKVTYAMLQEFENDLHLHIHLENNILFPKAIEMERNLLN